jgi:sugar/nucleoside kinase (ribokinase family)
MSLLVIGSIAVDTVETPSDRRENLLGGSASHFSCAARFFTPVQLVSVVGGDWPPENTEFLRRRDIDVSGIQVVPTGKSFRWSGRYAPNMNDRETLAVELDVFGNFEPQLSELHRRAKYIFLGNAAPATQIKALEQVPGRRLAVADTMDLWINIARVDLMRLLGMLDGLVLNDSEARLLSGTENLVLAGHRVRKLGPKFVIIKKGEHGAMFFGQHETYVLPAFPTEHVVDPTGAGDSFAGGMMGYLAEQDKLDPETLKTAMAYGILVASFNVEGFGLDRIERLTRRDIEARMTAYQKMLSF